MTKPNYHPSAVRRIHFEDRGQDFVWCDIDDIGEIVDVPPFHRNVWVGCIVCLEKLKEGRCCQYINPRTGNSEIRFKVTKIERLKEEEVYDE